LFQKCEKNKLYIQIDETNSMIIVFTFGFDEKFAIRSLLRRSVGGNDEVVVLIPSNRPDERSEKALAALDDFVSRYVNGKGVKKYEIEIDNLYVAVPRIAGLFRSWAKRPIILNLSGGMRLLIIETLIAAIYCGIPIRVELETEDGKTFAEFETHHLHPVQLDWLDVEIMKILEGNRMSLRVIAEALRVSRPTAWRHIKKLSESGFVKLEGVTDRKRMGGRFLVSSTARATLYLKLSGISYGASC